MKLRPLMILLAVFVVVVASLLIVQTLRQASKGPAGPPASPAPSSFAQTTPAAKVGLTIDRRIARYPALAQKLYRDGVKDLRSFAEQAKGDQAHLQAKGMPTRAYARTIAWTLAAATPRVVSVKQAWLDDTGGAHPNHGSSGLLWDPAADREVERSDLFRPAADQGRLDQRLCQAIKAEKLRHQGAVGDVQTWRCPKWADSDFVLAPSTVAGKAGGLIFLFDPYAIGPYVEGGYAVTIPLEAFKADLAPAYAAAFAGEPLESDDGPANG